MLNNKAYWKLRLVAAMAPRWLIINRNKTGTTSITSNNDDDDDVNDVDEDDDD